MDGVELYKKVYGISSNAVNRALLEKMRIQFARNLENGELDPLVKEKIRIREEEKKRAKLNKNKQSKKKKKVTKNTKKVGFRKGLKKR